MDTSETIRPEILFAHPREACSKMNEHTVTFRLFLLFTPRVSEGAVTMQRRGASVNSILY